MSPCSLCSGAVPAAAAAAGDGAAGDGGGGDVPRLVEPALRSPRLHRGRSGRRLHLRDGYPRAHAAGLADAHHPSTGKRGFFVLIPRNESHCTIILRLCTLTSFDLLLSCS